MKTVLGKDLKVGMTIEIWSETHLDTITELNPYKGPLAYLFPKGAKVAKCLHGSGLIIDNSDDYKTL